MSHPCVYNSLAASQAHHTNAVRMSSAFHLEKITRISVHTNTHTHTQADKHTHVHMFCTKTRVCVNQELCNQAFNFFSINTSEPRRKHFFAVNTRDYSLIPTISPNLFQKSCFNFVSKTCSPILFYIQNELSRYCF